MTSDEPGVAAGGDAEAVRETFEQLPVILGALSGPDYRFDAVNAAYRQFMGLQDVIGRSAMDIFPELMGQQIYALFDQVHQSGDVQSIREWRIQFDQGTTGELGEFFIDMLVGPRRSADGAIVGITLACTDVTDRVRQRQAAQQRAVEAERRFQAARDVVVEVQQALLSTSLPVLPGVDLAGRYLVAAQDQAAGGDWFDAVPLADAIVALVVGDIVGHGVAASAAMGQLRSVVNAVLTETGDLLQALSWADKMASQSPAMRAATVCVAILDPATGAVRYSTCGHPPPLLVAVDGRTRYVEASGNGPLGTGSTPVIIEEKLQPGELLLLYTDGLIERSGQTLQAGMRSLAGVVTDAAANRLMPIGAPDSVAERVCDQSIELITRFGYDDDITVVAVQRRPEPLAPLFLDMRAEPDALPEVRAAVHAWLWPLRLASHDVQNIDLTVTELVANVIEHAYRPAKPGRVRLRAQLTPDGVLQVQVADDGVWKEPTMAPDTSGRGLWLVGAVTDDMHVQHPTTDTGRAGTTITVRHQLRRPAVVTAEPPRVVVQQPARDFTAVLDAGPPKTLRVSGPLDIRTAGEFADRLDTAGRGGVYPVEVDLSDVDILASAAVSVLFTARDALVGHDHWLVVRAAVDTPADQVLKLVGWDDTHRETR